MKGFRRLVNGEESQDEETKYLEELKQCCKLSYRERLYGFATCFVVGFCLTMLSSFYIWDISTHPERFAITYTLGNIVGLAGTGFLIGPVRQIKGMFKETRVIATCVFLAAMGATLYFALGPKKAGLVLICIIVQFLAFAWYCASYIPFARRCIKKTLSSMV